MSRTLSDAAIAGFDRMIKHANQDGGKLAETVTYRTNVGSSTYRFNNLGKGVAKPRSTQTDVIPMNLVHTNQTATLAGWSAAEYTDIFDQAATNIQEREALASAVAKAIGRRRDQMIIDALEAASSTLTVATSVGGAGTDLNPAKLRRAQRLLGDTGADFEEQGGVTFVGSWYGKENMLAQEEVTSADYNTIRRLTNGEVNEWLGMSFCWIASRDEGGLTKSGNDRTNFAYTRASTGLASNLEPRVMVDWVPTKTSWLVNQIFQGGATHIDANSIVEVTTQEV